MKTITFKSVMVVLVTLFSLNANAYDAYINGIYYNLVPEEMVAEVTKGDDKYESYEGDVDIPSSFEKDGIKYSVTSIGDSAFCYCSYLTSVTIPNSVTSIGNSAFCYCI